MNTGTWKITAAATATAFLLWGCAPEGDSSQAGAPDAAAATAQAQPSAPPPAEASAPEPEQAPSENGASPLADTRWRLVNIASMDDTNYAPEDRDLYTLAFDADGSMSLRADCNRGSGSWSSESRSQLRFGPIAVTQALCPPESLHDRYLAQFDWVRSYVIEDGHLFLATMADGSIIEFEPVADE